jgi:hypothetical protein
MANTNITIVIENLAPTSGTSLTPFWVGLHDGNFDTYDRGRPASQGVERVAEDGTTAAISQEFTQAGFGSVQGVVAGANGPIAPGETAQFSLNVDGQNAQNRYFNYLAMLLPSNDFFVANGNERAHEIFDARGNFIGADFTILGRNVLDAGTEVGDEIPANTAFFGQTTPNTGVVENGVIRAARGFIPGGAILSDPRFANGDFTADGYQVARIRLLNTVTGNNGANNLLGTDRDDLILGNEGDDLLAGFGSNDILNGGTGDDILRGGNGDDQLTGGTGKNRLVGGSGKDQFMLAKGEGVDMILDFNRSGDRLRLQSGLQFSDLAFEQQGRNTVVRSGEDQLAVLYRVNAGSITEGLFT